MRPLRNRGPADSWLPVRREIAVSGTAVVYAAVADWLPDDLERPKSPPPSAGTEPGGYRLDTQGGLIDAREYDALSSAGHRALEQRDWAEASSYFRRALALWHGRALADVQCGPLLEVEATGSTSRG
ncbi:hypothetical protein STENM223S_05212 [Streptomyces tendae]